MADDRLDTTGTPRPQGQWRKLLTLFLTAVDPRKLLLAASGILLMSVGWWVLSLIFFNFVSAPNENAIRDEFKDVPEAERPALVEKELAKQNRSYAELNKLAGPGGKLRTMPWYEERGDNPFEVATGLINASGDERREIAGRFASGTLPVLVEPLIKFFRPVLSIIKPGLYASTYVYLALVIVWTLAVWAFFGGVITRMAVTEIAQRDQGGVKDAIAFVSRRYLSYLTAPLLPLIVIVGVGVGCIVYGLLHLVPVLGDVLTLFYPLIIVAGLVMTVMLLGLVVYPLMYATISAEGADTLEGMTRPYSFLIGSPWRFLWYGFVSVLYGAALMFFVVLVSSFMVYLGKAAVNQTPFIESADRKTEYLFVYTPSSFGWQELLLRNSPIEVDRLRPGEALTLDKDAPRPSAPGYKYTRPEDAKKYLDSYYVHNTIAAGIVNFWVTLFFLMVLGFGYSFFWVAGSMIYLLLRQDIDETEIDEVYTEDEALEAPVMPKPAAPEAATNLIPPPAIRPPAPPAAPPAPEPTAVAMTPPAAPPEVPPPAQPEVPTPVPPSPPTPPVVPPTAPVEEPRPAPTPETPSVPSVPPETPSVGDPEPKPGETPTV